MLKQELIILNIPALYDPNAETTVSADVSSHGPGTNLLQKLKDQWHIITHTSCSMTHAELQSAQTKKEALAAAWGN